MAKASATDVTLYSIVLCSMCTFLTLVRSTRTKAVN